jgi:hypothetical protein
MKSSLEWQVAEMCFLERMRVRSAVLMLDWEMIKELTFWTETGECSLAEPDIAKAFRTVQNSFLLLTRVTDARQRYLNQVSIVGRGG